MIKPLSNCIKVSIINKKCTYNLKIKSRKEMKLQSVLLCIFLTPVQPLHIPLGMDIENPLAPTSVSTLLLLWPQPSLLQSPIHTCASSLQFGFPHPVLSLSFSPSNPWQLEPMSSTGTVRCNSSASLWKNPTREHSCSFFLLFVY